MANAKSNDPINDLDEFLDTVDENGKHRAVVKEFKFNTSNKDNRCWNIFTFEVSDDDSPLDGEPYPLWIQDWSHLSVQDYQDLEGKQKSKVRADRRRLYDTLIGVGYSEDEAKEIRRDPKSELRKDCIDTDVWITIRANGNFKNVTNVALMSDDDSEHDDIPF